MLGNVVFVYPSYNGIFNGVSPIQLPLVPDTVGCKLSVGGLDGTLYQESQPWVETCKMFKD